MSRPVLLSRRGSGAKSGAVPPGGGGVPFGSRPEMAAASFYYVGNVSIDNKTIVGNVGGPPGVGIEAERGLAINGSHVTSITNCDFVGVDGVYGTGIYMDDCSGPLIISNCRFYNVGWNAIQLNHTVTTGGRISDIKILKGRNEDMISLQGACGGSSASDPLIFERIYCEGDPNKTRPSGSGFMTEGAQHVTFRNFTMLNPGQVGFGLHPGINIKFQNYKIYSQAYKASWSGDTGMDVGDPAINGSIGTEVSNGEVKWYYHSGGENPYSSSSFSSSIAGWNTNNWSAPLDPAALAVIL